MVGKQTNGQKRGAVAYRQTLKPERSVFKKSLPGFSLSLLRAIFAIPDGPSIHEITTIKSTDWDTQCPIKLGVRNSGPSTRHKEGHKSDDSDNVQIAVMRLSQ